MTTQILVRIDQDLKRKVARLARAEGKNLSEITIYLLEAYVKTRDIGGYIDELWHKIGSKLKNRDLKNQILRQSFNKLEPLNDKGSHRRKCIYFILFWRKS